MQPHLGARIRNNVRKWSAVNKRAAVDADAQDAAGEKELHEQVPKTLSNKRFRNEQMAQVIVLPGRGEGCGGRQTLCRFLLIM